MSQNLELIISGSIAIDQIMNFSGKYKDVIKPDKIHVLSISVMLKDLKTTHGGSGANIAYCSALFKEKPVLLGAVGQDALPYMKKLKKCGVDTSNIFYSKLKTASFNVINDSDDNQIGGFYPGAMIDAKNNSFQKWKNNNAIFVISANDSEAMKQQVKECKKYKLRMVYDFGQQIINFTKDELLEGVNTAEIVIANDYEMDMLCNKIGYTQEKLKSTVPICITTLGGKGSLIEGKNVKAPIKVGIATPKSVLDPTGAGDAYRSGFLYGYARNWDLKVCGQIGAVSSAYAVETYGTQEHHFTLKEFQKRYKKAFNQSLPINS